MGEHHLPSAEPHASQGGVIELKEALSIPDTMAGQARNLCGVRLSHMWLLATPALSVADEGELPEGQARAIIPVSGMTCGDCRVKVETEVVKIDGMVEVKEATHPPPCEPVPGRRTIVHASTGV